MTVYKIPYSVSPNIPFYLLMDISVLLSMKPKDKIKFEKKEGKNQYQIYSSLSKDVFTKFFLTYYP